MIEYPYSLIFVVTTINGYGDETASDEFEVACAMQESTGFRHANNQNVLESDAIAFVDPADDFVVDRNYRLEDLKCYAEMLDGSRTWYRVTSVSVARQTQLGNDVDNVQLTLKATAPPQGAAS